LIYEKNKIATLFLTTAAFFCLPNLSAQKTTTMVSINVSESQIHWLGKKITGQHEGKINLLSGSLIMDNGSLTGGDFTIKGITNPAAFELQVNDLKDKVIIDRKLYDILHGSSLFFGNLKDKVIYNDFEIDVNLKL